MSPGAPFGANKRKRILIFKLKEFAANEKLKIIQNLKTSSNF
jgi:hypothetical protein